MMKKRLELLSRKLNKVHVTIEGNKNLYMVMLGFISKDDLFITKYNSVDNIKLLCFRVGLLFFKLI